MCKCAQRGVLPGAVHAGARRTVGGRDLGTKTTAQVMGGTVVCVCERQGRFGASRCKMCAQGVGRCAFSGGANVVRAPSEVDPWQ